MINMAILELPVGYFELTPVHGLHEDVAWYKTQISLELVIANQSLVLENQNAVSIQRADFLRFIKGIHLFIQSRVQAEDEFTNSPKNTFEFTPLELYFSFSCLEGDVNENLEGEITVRIMLNLDSIENQLSSSYVGGEFNIDSQGLLKFCQCLEQELSQNQSPNRI